MSNKEFKIQLYLTYCKNMGLDFKNQENLEQYKKWA